MQRQTTSMPYLLKDKQCKLQITRPRMGKKVHDLAFVYIKAELSLNCFPSLAVSQDLSEWRLLRM